ncbi:WD repeat-containing and planar cell polarity effector protein fritz homolog [Tubulanus polymorphus]|uniref:WD repeat-containing and planar cell polarity effector protein fritz homolog n=1 Tax=Tubulanus polymorphus TaxID=672921 RepID=UPI003DA4655C
MASVCGNLHLWTVKYNTFIADGEIGCHSYHDKVEQVLPREHPYDEERKQLEEAQGISWIPKNKRPEKLRDTLKEAEDLLQIHKCIHIRWRTRRYVQLILNNGILIVYILAGHSGDVERIFIDRSLIGKISTDIINDAIFTDNFMAFTYCDKSKLEFVQFNKKLPSGQAIKKLEKLSIFYPKYSQLELPGPSGRRLDRRLSVNLNQDLILVWWSTSSDEAWPWSPMTSDRERANLTVISLINNKIDLLCYARTDCDPIYAGFSLIQSQQIFTIEQTVGSGGELSIDNCIYETARNKIQRAAVTTIPLKTTVISHCRNQTEEKLMLGGEDHSLILYDDYRRVTQITQAAILPQLIVWHPDGVLVFVANNKGDIQVFDAALAPLMIQLVAETITPCRVLRMGQNVRNAVVLKRMSWCNVSVTPSDQVTNAFDPMLLYFDGGPIATFQLCTGVYGQHSITASHLINEYIRYKQIDEAINLLCGLNWNRDGQTCFCCLSTIINHLLKNPLNVDREAQLEAVLGAFYAPSRPLAEVTVIEYREAVMKFARRFFHHLLRFSRFDKAFLLAVDIGARDLFMDIHYLAKDKGEHALAEVARKKAEAIEMDRRESDTDSSSTGTEERSDDDQDYEDDSFYDETDLDKSENDSPPQRVRLHRAPAANNPTNQSVYDGYDADELDEDLTKELYNEYTQALLQNQEPNDQLGDTSASRVKVIHFGLV